MEFFVYGCLQTHWHTCLLLLDEDILVCVLTSGKAEDAPRKPNKFISVLSLHVALSVWRDSFFRYLSSVCTENLDAHERQEFAPATAHLQACLALVSQLQWQKNVSK